MAKETKKIEKEAAKNSCNDEQCPVHGSLKVRGRIFKGYVTRKFPRRIVIEFGKTAKIIKYERYMKTKTRIHARLPACMENEIKLGDYVLVQECRPLSKMIHFVYIGKVSKEGK